MAQVFNSIEEITENTVNDTDSARVAEHKQMRFEIRGYSTLAGNRKNDNAFSEQCANSIRTFLTQSGTPRWRLVAKGLGHRKSAAERAAATRSIHKLSVEFLRTK